MDEITIQKQGTFGLPQRREEVSSILKECFSKDFFEIEDFETRIEKAQNARTLEELESIIADIPEQHKQLKSHGNFSPPGRNESSQIELKNSTKKIQGAQLQPRDYTITLAGSVLKLDYRDIELLPAELSIKIDAKGSVCRIIVPPGIGIAEEISNTASVFKYRRSRRFSQTPVQTVIHLTGKLEGSVLKVKTRKERRKKHKG